MKNKFKERLNYKRILHFLLILFILSANAIPVFTQASDVLVKKSIKMKNVTVQQLVDNLGADFKYSFFIVDKQVAKTLVTVDKKNATVNEILDEAFKGKEIVYDIKDKNIIISVSKKPEQPTDLPKTITGIITDDNFQPIIGATIKLQDSNTGTISDFNGRFSLEVVERGKLIVSYIGYNTQVINISQQSNYSIVLQEDTKILDEIIVVGYGTQRKGNLTGSISSVKSDKLTTAPITNVTNALAGQLPGLKTKQTSGIPGSDGAALSIRGFNSPLVIVDGVETSFSNIDASQIESISVLKDGAASIYGARAGNGVVLVTLKRGMESKVTVSANASTTLQNSTSAIRTGSSGQRAEFERESHINANLPSSQVPWSLTEIQKFYNGTDPDYINTDWFTAAIRPWSPQQNHNVTITGGSKKIKFYSYLGYNNQETISRSDGGGYDRINLQTTIDAEILEGLVFSTSVNYIKENRDFTSMNLFGKNYYFALYDSDPRFPLSFPDETMLSYAGSSYGNAVHVASRKLAGYSRNDNHSIRTNGSLTYDFKAVKGLKLKAFVNYNGSFGLSKVFKKQPNFYRYEADTDSYLFERKSQDPPMLSHGTYFSEDMTQQYSVSYENTFNEDHQLSILALHERINYRNEGFDTQRGNFTSTIIDQLFAGDPETAANSSTAAEMGRSSFVGRINYGYKNRYLIETIFRADASAKFPVDGRWGYFPSVSLGWVASQEEFLKHSNVLDNLKLRGSFGQSGDDGIGNYQYYAGYAYDMSYILGETIYQGLYSTGLANPLLSWERLSIYNGGIDFSLFKRKLYGSVEGFYRLREGIPGYRTQSLPSTFGATLPLENLNSIDTRGFDFEIGTAKTAGKFKYDISANISWARSKWVSFDEPEFEDPEQERIYAHSGKWTDVRFGYISDGLFTTVDEIEALKFSYVDLGGNESIRIGDVKYVDVNEDGKLDWKDMVEIGKGTMPSWMYGMNMNFKYSNFDLSMLFQGAFGYTTYIDLEMAPTTLKYDNRWTEKTNDRNALVPRPGSKNSANWLYSDYRNHNSAYVRLKSMSVGYELGRKALETLKLSKVRFYLAGTNLLTFSTLDKYGVDPEAPEGTPAYYYPQQRTVSVGISLNY